MGAASQNMEMLETIGIVKNYIKNRFPAKSKNMIKQSKREGHDSERGGQERLE